MVDIRKYKTQEYYKPKSKIKILPLNLQTIKFYVMKKWLETHKFRFTIFLFIFKSVDF